ncbi:LysR family transcriptional regulator [Marinobacter oulmenensis]|uniref:DNA-binding transcriptional LysR family regulator n=1 Tax=Marinobacter oulmenensis TaxID=643747 RepID=A0A840UFL9_9GAMM|nr:LysR family transcriptional regulator [Marinobacter oulmenensis]MBB5319956.1 DNA-binding transcriptional LysR family regulator [Marinobacter oulmenensis]
MYDFQELEAFVSVVRTGSLTASTRDLGLPKSTLSRRIRQLEEAVGQPLLLRQSRRILPNEAGRVFYRYSNDMLELASQGREALDELREEVSGRLSLRCHESFVRGWFSKLVESFMESHPDLRVAIGTQRAVPESLDSDVCIWLGPVGDTALRQENLGNLTQGVYGSPDYFREHGSPQTPGDLDDHRWVDLLGDSAEGVVLRHSRLGVYPLTVPDRGLTVDQLSVQGDAIASGRGLGLMPHWLVEKRLQAHPGTLEPCLTEWQGPALPVTMLYPHGHLPRRVRAFLANIRAAVPAAWGQSVSVEGENVP